MTNPRVKSSLFVMLLVGFAHVGGAQTATPPTAASDLTGTAWQLLKFQGGDDKTLTPGDKSKYTVAFDQDGVSVRIDCNRGRGAWKSYGPDQLEFKALALTRAMCPEAELSDRFTRDLASVRSYVLKDGHLFLSLMADGGAYEFEPISPGGPETRQIKGTASYRERMVLPPKAVFEAILEDVSKAGAAATVIGRVRKEHPGNPPFAFAIPYDPARIQSRHRYGVRARILADGNLLFITDQSYPVLGEGQSKEVSLLMRRAELGASASQDAVSLENSYWKLTHLGEQAVAVASHQKEPHLILKPEMHRVGGSGNCNGFTGNYEVSGDQLTFSQMATTMIACPSGMETDQAFVNALMQVKTWKISGQQLELFDADSRRVARLQVREME